MRSIQTYLTCAAVLSSKLVVQTEALEEQFPCSLNHSQEAVAFAEYAHCQPHSVLVPIPFPTNDLSIQRLHPSHVFMKRCLGLRGALCQPGTKEVVKVPVILEKCETNSEELCQRSCANIEMESHTSCVCGCPLQTKADCPPKKLIQDEDCSCQCEDQEGKEACLNHSNRTWDDDLCQCRCHTDLLRICPQGHVFDFFDTCSCVLWNEDILLQDMLTLGTEADENELKAAIAFSWELVVIMVLCCILFVLATITVLLLKRIALMSHKSYCKAQWPPHPDEGIASGNQSRRLSPIYVGLQHQSPY
eukprot:TCALIF_04954-PA protein Name:"Protein of unknown function" AED:0.29 eAED:0.29 QI:295/0.25/0.2/0.4/0.75/0.6/5/0/303